MRIVSLALFFTTSILIFNVKTSELPGNPIDIAWISNENEEKIDLENLKNIFNHPEVENRKFFIVSVTGPVRKGKSFLMDYCLRYLYANFHSVNCKNNSLDHKDNWLDENEFLTGFTTFSRNHTERLAMWSDVFLTDDGETAIMLMDMQGFYDRRTGVFNESDGVKLFALGALISSVQIYSDDKELQEYNFNFLEKSTDFAQIVQEKATNFSSTPFQKLIFLILNWENEHFRFGHGGDEYLQETITKVNQAKFINSTFENVSCYLMQKPGTFFGNRLKGLNPEFIENYKLFIEWLFAPENIVQKSVFGDVKTGKDLLDFIENQLKRFQSFAGKDPSGIVNEIFENHLKNATKIYEEGRKTTNLHGTESSHHEIHEKASIMAENYLKSFNIKSGNKIFNETLLKLRNKIDLSFKDFNLEWKENQRKMRLLTLVFILLIFIISTFLVASLIKQYKIYQLRHQDIALTDFDDSLWEIEREKLDQMYSIGKGNFGEVFKGILQSNKENNENEIVALKTLKLEKHAIISDKDFIARKTELERKFINEARMMTKFNTHHVMKLKGYWIRDKPYLMVMEYAEHGDLKSFLLKFRENLSIKQLSLQAFNYMNLTQESSNMQDPCELKIRPLKRMALEIADGMAYLEGIKYVHRDLAARNCMVTSDFTVKIGDFGMSRLVDSSNYYKLQSNQEVPLRWCAPENLKSAKFSIKSDVFSFGILLWEIVTLGDLPYPLIQQNCEVLKFIQSGRIMTKPEQCDDFFYNLMKKCWKFEPSKRPNFQEVIKSLLAVKVDGDEEFITIFQNKSFFYNQKSEASRIPFNHVLNFKFSS